MAKLNMGTAGASAGGPGCAQRATADFRAKRRKRNKRERAARAAMYRCGGNRRVRCHKGYRNTGRGT